MASSSSINGSSGSMICFNNKPSEGVVMANSVKEAIGKYERREINFYMLYYQTHNKKSVKRDVSEELRSKLTPRENLISHLFPHSKTLASGDPTLAEIEPLVNKILKNDIKDLFAFVACNLNTSQRVAAIMEVLFEYHEKAPSLLEVDAKWRDPKTEKEISAMNKILELLKTSSFDNNSRSLFTCLPEIVLGLFKARSREARFRVTLIQDSPKFIWLTADHLARWLKPKGPVDSWKTSFLHHTLDHLLAFQAALEIDCTEENLRATLDHDAPYLSTHILRGLKPNERAALPVMYLRMAEEKYDEKSNDVVRSGTFSRNLLLPFMLPQEVAKIGIALFEMLKVKAPSELFLNSLKDYVILSGDWECGQKIFDLYKTSGRKEQRSLAAVLERAMGLQSILEASIIHKSILEEPIIHKSIKNILPIIHSYDSDIPIE